MLVAVGKCMLNLVFRPWQKLHGVTRPLSLKTDVIKKRNRNGSSLAASSRKPVPAITATGAARGIVTAKGRNSMTSAAGLPPPTRTLAPSSGLGSPTELAMKRQRRTSGNISLVLPPSAGIASESA
jgi:hypothetical protein